MRDAQIVCFSRPGEASLMSTQVPSPEIDEVLVEHEYSAISAGTERAQLLGEPNTPRRFPFHPGYSSVGTVVEVGSGVTQLSVGQRVFVPDHSHANICVTKAHQAVPIPHGVSPLEAVFTRIASFSLLSIRRSRLEIGESVVVVGTGMLGLFAVQLAMIGGALPIIAVGTSSARSQTRLTLARNCGATHIANMEDQTTRDTIVSLCPDRHSADLVVETSGSESGLAGALTYAGQAGRIMVAGCQRTMKNPIDVYSLIHMKGVSLIGAHANTRPPYNSSPGNWTAQRDYLTLLRLMEARRMSLPFKPEVCSSDDITGLYERLASDPDFPLGAVIQW